MVPCGGTAKPGYEACCWSEVAGKYIYVEYVDYLYWFQLYYL